MLKYHAHKNQTLTIVFGVILAFIASNNALAQYRPQYSQYMFNGLSINPAYAGAEEDLSLTFINRSQWVNVEGAPTTQTFTGHTLVKDKNLGIGANVLYDQIGIHKSLIAQLNTSYHIAVSENAYLSMGISAGVNNRRSDYNSLYTSTQNDPKITQSDLSGTSLDFGAGIYYRSPRLHIGFSVPNLSANNVSYYDSLEIDYSDPNYYLFSRYRFVVNKYVDIEPGMLLKFIPEVPVSYDLYTNFIFYNVLTLGTSYRKDESLDLLCKIQLTTELQIGYAYDHVIGQVSTLSNSSHEFMINYTFRTFESKTVSPR